MSKIRNIRTSWIIHLFALLHALVALGCRLAGVEDQLLLTVLTMALSIIICMKMNLKVEFTASIVIIVNILGFLIGTFGARMLQTFITSEYLVHCISTTITTEILGWCIVAITRIFGQKSAGSEDMKSSPYMKWLLLIASGIFILRLLIVVILSQSAFDQESIFQMIRKVMTNSVSLIILICVNILFIRSIATKDKGGSRVGTISIYATFMILATLLETFLVGSEGDSFTLLFLISLIVQITVYCIIYMINYAVTMRLEMLEEREKANMAQYRYMKLKHQVNPHFLFNSLNILDCLICEEETERASTYTHKLAGIYRYMIKSEDEELVKLSDELIFIEKYTDLLKVRFTEGLQIEMNIADDCLNKLILPCSLQLLIENATKHNAVSADNPLKIRIEASDGTARVRNNIIPKIAHSQSTGLGHKYISRQYLDLCGKSIEIDITENDYCVTLPLL